MAKDSKLDKSCNAVLKKNKHFSLVWVIPVLALIITSILVWKNTIHVGSEVKLFMPNANGIEAGKTLVKFRSVVVGTVTDISFTKDFSKVIATIQMKPDTDELLNSDSKFWVVKPRIESTSITGLDTILSGPYIQLNKGNRADFKTKFDVLDLPPVLDENGKGKYITLVSSESKKINIGDPIIYKGFNVGSISQVILDSKSNNVRYTAFVEDKYKKLVGENSVFWSYSGVDFSFGATSLDVKFDNLVNILQGGITFENIPDFQISKKNDEYTLYKDKASATRQILNNLPRFVVMIEDNIGNIKIGSPVTLKGINIGEVIEAPWYEKELDLYDKNSKIPVLIAIKAKSENQSIIKNKFINNLEKGSLCATIEASNLISGNNTIALNVSNKKCSNIFESYRDIPVIPTIQGRAIPDLVKQLLEKINSLDLKGFSKEISSSISHLDKLLKEMSKSFESFNNEETIVKFNKTLLNLDKSLESLHRTLNSYDKDSELYNNLNQSLDGLNSLVFDLENAVNNISRKPSSIIFGASDDDPEIIVKKN